MTFVLGLSVVRIVSRRRRMLSTLTLRDSSRLASDAPDMRPWRI